MKDLFTQEDIREVRHSSYEKQSGFDPILGRKIELKDAVLDHDHISQKCRAAIHRQTNSFEGLVFNAYRRCIAWLSDESLPTVLRNLATYLEQDYSENDNHPGWIKRVKTDFEKLKESQKDYVLKELGLAPGSNSKERKTSFSKNFLTRKNGYDRVRSVINKAKEITNV
jgi:hypothetical protein